MHVSSTTLDLTVCMTDFVSWLEFLYHIAVVALLCYAKTCQQHWLKHAVYVLQSIC